MQLLADYFPLLLFFVAFKWHGIYVATAVAIAASVVQLAWFGWRRKVSPIHWLSFGIIVIFGGATLLLRDETFIKWKPSVLYWLAGIVFLGGLAFGTNLVKAVMGEGLTLPEPVWTKLAIAWGVFSSRCVGKIAETAFPHLSNVGAAFLAFGVDMATHVILECLAQRDLRSLRAFGVGRVNTIGKLTERLLGGLAGLLDSHIRKHAEF